MTDGNFDVVRRSRATGARLRVAGLIVLVLGLGIACARLFSNSATVDAGVDLANADTSKKVARDQEMNFGKMGVLSSDLSSSLHDPVTQAVIVAVAAVLASAACFYIAHLQDRAEG